MLKRIEDLANKIVDYLDNKPKKQKPLLKISKKEKSETKKVFFEIFPYFENNFGFDVFNKFLSNFSNCSERIDFYIVGGNNIKIIISVPDFILNKFETAFYNNFPSSKINKINFSELTIKKYIYTSNEDSIQIITSNYSDFFKNSFSNFKSLSDFGLVKYSLIMKSIGETQEYEGILMFIWRIIKTFFYWIFYFVYRLFSNKKPKLIKPPKKTKIETGITGTAISIGLSGTDNFIYIFHDFFIRNMSCELYLDDVEKFSKTTISDFSKMFFVPTKDINIKGLENINYKRLAPPSNLPNVNDDITVLGTANWTNDETIIGVKQEDKARHVYIVGKTGVGKSTLLSNMIFSDLERGRGLALIDPHGDLVKTILDVIPENRKDDVILFDVADTQNVVGFNVFDKQDNENSDLLVSTILSIFEKLYGHSRGPRLEHIFRNALLTLVEYDGANFMHILKILTDKDFRKKVLIEVNDKIKGSPVKEFWEKDFAKRSERFRSEAISPITNKVGQFVSSSIIRNIFCQKNSTISFKNIMNENKILLVNLSKGLIGEDNASMIGSFVVSWIQLETMKKAQISLSERKSFTLYIDEFQNFVTDSFKNILAEARKYNLSLVVANQYISQVNNELQNAIFGNVGNLICFNSGDVDANILSRQFKNKVNVDDILSIPRFKAYSKIMIDGTSSEVLALNTCVLDNNLIKKAEYIQSVVENSNKKYTRKKEEVEKQIISIMGTEENLNLEKIKKKDNNDFVDNKEKVNEKLENKEDKKEQIYDGIVKLKFNYGLFVQAGPYEGLLHKKNITLPEGILRKDYFNIGDKIKVRALEFKTLDGITKAVREYV